MADEIIKLLEYLLNSELVQGLAIIYIIGFVIAVLLTVLIFISAAAIIARAYKRTRRKWE